jgi:hypothetical protein
MATKIRPINLHASVDTHVQGLIDSSYITARASTFDQSAISGSLVFEGSTADSHETTLIVTDPTADRTVTIPNATGTVITTGNLDDMTQQDHGLITGSVTISNDYGSVA